MSIATAACKHGESIDLECAKCDADDYEHAMRVLDNTMIERDRYCTALETIAESCNTIESATEVAREALGGKR